MLTYVHPISFQLSEATNNTRTGAASGAGAGIGTDVGTKANTGSGKPFFTAKPYTDATVKGNKV